MHLRMRTCFLILLALAVGTVPAKAQQFGATVFAQILGFDIDGNLNPTDGPLTHNAFDFFTLTATESRQFAGNCSNNICVILTLNAFAEVQIGGIGIGGTGRSNMRAWAQGAFRGSSLGQAQWVDNVAPTSATLPEGSPVSYKVTATFEGTTTGEPVFASSPIARGQLQISLGIPGDFVIPSPSTSGPFSITKTVIWDTFVGAPAHTFHAFLEVSTATADPDTASIDARDTVTFFIDPITDGASYSTASGATYFSPKIDTTVPTTASFLSGSLGANGWYTSPVTLTLTATDIDGPADIAGTSYSLDGGSVQSYTAPFGVFNDGVHTIQFSSIDKAGNAEVPHAVTFKIDQTPPHIIGLRSPDPNAHDWNNSPVTIMFQCSDALSGLATGSPPSATVVSTQGSGQSVKGTCADLAGNSISLTVPDINIDATPPQVTVTASSPTLWPPNGKLVPDLLTGTITDALSGIDSSTAMFRVLDEYRVIQPGGQITVMPDGRYSFGVALEASRLEQDLDGRHYQVIVSVTDKAGNPTSVSIVVTVPNNQRR